MVLIAVLYFVQLECSYVIHVVIKVAYFSEDMCLHFILLLHGYSLSYSVYPTSISTHHKTKRVEKE